MKTKTFNTLVLGLASVFILGLPLLAWMQGLEGNAFLYRNEFIAGLWRFATVGLAAWGAKSLLTSGREKMLGALGIILLLHFLIPVFLLSLIIFGLAPALHYNAPGFLLPSVLALGVVLAPWRVVCCAPQLRSFVVIRFLCASVLTAAILAVFALAVFLIAPMGYTWHDDYLTRKYHAPARSLASRKAIPGPDTPPPPLGLVVKYLLFGERAVDYGAMFD